MKDNIPQFEPCGKCINGYIITKEKGQETALECECRKEWFNEASLIINLMKANIPISVKDYTIDSYIGEDKNRNIERLHKYINKFKNKFKDKILYIYGDNGTQKTTISYWIGRELLKKGISVYYTLMNSLIRDLQENQFDKETDIEKYKKVDCLIIDRAFESNQLTIYKSGYQLSFIDTFLRERIDLQNKAIIFVSNVPYNEISKHGFNDDIEDLISRKVRPYNMDLKFIDHYTLSNYFENLWED